MSYSDLERSIDPHPAETAVTGLFCLSVVWLSAVSIKRYFETGKIGSPVDHPAAASLVLLSLAGMQAFEIKRSLANGVAQLASPPGLRGSMDFSRRSAAASSPRAASSRKPASKSYASAYLIGAFPANLWSAAVAARRKSWSSKFWST